MNLRIARKVLATKPYTNPERIRRAATVVMRRLRKHHDGPRVVVTTRLVPISMSEYFRPGTITLPEVDWPGRSFTRHLEPAVEVRPIEWAETNPREGGRIPLGEEGRALWSYMEADEVARARRVPRG